MALTLLLSGGLGNQLFQYAAVRSLALRLETDLTIDARFYPPESMGGAKGMWLTDFPIRARIKSHAFDYLPPHHILRRIYRKLIAEPARRRYQEPSLGFHPEFFELKDDAIISGNFQSPLYFESNYHLFANELDMLEAGILPPTKFINGIPISECIGVHIRRGDYIGDPVFDMANRDKYYMRAISMMRDVRGKNCPIVVVSDDIDWCKAQPYLQKALFTEAAANAKPYLDLFLLSQCGSLIIANSSFSWWSGFFAYRNGAHVICPSPWIGGIATNDIAIAPKGWTIV
jgi:hypothetical protein